MASPFVSHHNSFNKVAGCTPFVDRKGENIEAQGVGYSRECLHHFKLDGNSW